MMSGGKKRKVDAEGRQFQEKWTEAFFFILRNAVWEQPEETINQYFKILKQLSRDCDFKSVSATGYRDEYIPNSFINGINFTHIRQSLLKNKTLNLNVAIRQAQALEMPQENAESYRTPNYVCTVNRSEQLNSASKFSYIYYVCNERAGD
ncbi:uncharacterized protein [Halyomorpha halys]|uniref:uncharacterized protein n=1 Tax=Halyomorpha halys TaxID=286706 RepID=UPI0034D17798